MESFNSILAFPYVFHCGIVSVVFIGAVLLFVFSFRAAEEPLFKSDSRSNGKKKKGKEKKLLNGNVNSTESSKTKGNSTLKPKAKNAEENQKSRKPSALKDSKKINLNHKNEQKEVSSKKEQKKKGKENIDAVSDFEDVDGLWEQALSRKKSRKNQNLIPEVLKKDKKPVKGNEAKKAKDNGNKPKDSAKKDSTMKGDKSKDDDGDWQEAKSSKKRRKVQKED